MKIHEYNEMMAYLTRPAMAYGGRIGLKKGTQLLPKNIRLTEYGKYRFSSEVSGKFFSKTFDTLKEAENFRDSYLKKFGIEEGQLRKVNPERGKYESVKGQKHIKFNGVNYQVNIQRGDEGAQYFSNLNDAIKERNKLVKKYPPKSFTDYNIKEKPKQVNADILELYKDPTIKNMFKNGVLDEKGIAKAAKILGVSKGTAIDRLEQLSTALMGTRKDVPGIKPAFTENARKIAASLPGAKTKAAELATGVSLEGESIKVPKQEIVAKADYPANLFDIDEARATATGLKKSTSPWSIFGQIIDRDVNRITKGGFEGAGWDSRAGTLEGELDDAVKNFGPDSKEAKAAMNKYNSAATKFENEVNSKKLRGAKRFRIPRISLDAPSKTIANWANFNKKYKDVFNENFKAKRYGFVIPQDLKTIPELRNEVLNPKSSTYKTMVNHLKKGFNEYDEKKLFQKIRRMTDEAPDAVKKIMRLIPRIAQVDDISDRRYASASNIMTSGVQYVDDEDENFVERNPITTAVAAPFLSKASGMTASKGLGVKSKLGRNIFDPLKLPRKGARWIGKKAFQALGSVPAALYFFQDTVRDGMREGKSFADSVIEAEAGIELLYPEIAKKAGFGMKVFNPIAKRLTPWGWSITGAGIAEDVFTKSQPGMLQGKFDPEKADQVLPALIEGYEKKWMGKDESPYMDYSDAMLKMKDPDDLKATYIRNQMKENQNQGGRVGFENGSGLPIDPMDPDKKLNAVLKAYKRYRRGEKNPKLSFQRFFEIYAKENFATGGRVGFDEGSKPKSPGRRTFIKGITALAALPLVGRFFKLGKVLERASTYTGPAIEKIKGMPEWFPGLVKKLWNEGEDVTKTAGYKERMVVRRGTLEGGDDIDLVYDLDTGDVAIEVAGKKNKSGYYSGETKSGAYNKEYALEYKKGEVLEESGKKVSDEFSVGEMEGRMDPQAMDIDWDANYTTVDDAMSDLTELEAFAKNKTTKQIHKKKGTKPKDVFPDYDPY